jgi:hypothetical protein
MLTVKGWNRRGKGSASWLAYRVAMLAVGLGAISVADAASLDAALLPKIQAATFEVVAAKPVADPLSYEKPLPLDLLPYQERTDKYYSIGTAFAIGHNRYVTAGHVLMAGLDSLWGAPELRDASGHVYAIDKVEKFSLRKDFVVFSLAGDPAGAALEVNTKPVLNQEIYAVGNALGTGVVIRDGLYTSDTPEQEDGSWKWMRFSAAASPGNSGGPLLDKEGKVVGVVLMKSANENLNYALAMSELLDAPEHQAVVDKRVSYQFDAFDLTLNNRFKAQFALPLSLPRFFETYAKLLNAYTDEQLKAILAKDAEHLFPRGDGSNRLLYGGPSLNTLPALIARGSSGEWGLEGHTAARVPLAANGYLAAGAAGHSLMLHLRRPDNLPAEKLYNDPALLGSLLVKVGPLTRSVGPEEVKLTGLGKPTLDTTHTDAWQRRWQVRVWPMPYANINVVVFALPVPDGYAIVMRPAPADDTYDYLADMRTLTDFIAVAYEGTLAQWKEYLQNTALLPAAFKDIHIEADYQRRFSYASKRVNFSYTPELQKVEPDNLLTLGFGFLNERGKVVWDVSDVRVKLNAQDPDRINIQRNTAPPTELDDNYKSEWNKIAQGLHPFEGVAFGTDGETHVASTANVPAGAAPGVRYTAFYGVSGSKPQETMKPKLDLLLKNLQVNEH